MTTRQVGDFTVTAVSDGVLYSNHDVILGVDKDDSARLTGFPYGQPLPLDVHHEKPVYRGVLELLTGPHRIEAGWWDRRGQSDGHAGIGDVTRDYYVASSPEAGLLWIYRERILQEGDNWFLHGVFA